MPETSTLPPPALKPKLLELFERFSELSTQKVGGKAYRAKINERDERERLMRDIPEMIKRECAFSELGGIAIAGAAFQTGEVHADPHSEAAAVALGDIDGDKWLERAALVNDFVDVLPAAGGVNMQIGERTVRVLREVLSHPDADLTNPAVFEFCRSFIANANTVHLTTGKTLHEALCLAAPLHENR